MMHKIADKKFNFTETIYFPKKIQPKGLVYKNKFHKIKKFIAEFDKFKKIYYVADYGSKAAVIVCKKNNILLTRQYRFLLNDISYEIPGGKTNKRETPKRAAIRECLEETGFFCKDLKLLIKYEIDLEYTKNPTYIFQTSKAEKIKNKNKKFVWINLSKCMKMIKNGKIRDSLSIMAILAKQKIRKIK